MFENEEWRIIEEFPRYQVSNHGRVKNVAHTNARKITLNDRGFPVVVLFGIDRKTRYLRQVNKLVATAFLPPPPSFDDQTGYDMNSVWHIDGDLSNCRADNLRWETRPHVIEWNEMHRTGTPRYAAHIKVRNNKTGITYPNAFECAMAEGELESKIIWRIERQAMHLEDDTARYRYVFTE